MAKGKFENMSIIKFMLSSGVLFLIIWLLDHLPDIIRFLIKQF